jgi:hypothetical protein
MMKIPAQQCPQSFGRQNLGTAMGRSRDVLELVAAARGHNPSTLHGRRMAPSRKYQVESIKSKKYQAERDKPHVAITARKPFLKPRRAPAWATSLADGANGALD